VSTLLPVEDHLAAILALVEPMPPEMRSLDEAGGCTLRESVRAAMDLPVFDNSAMDGFAVRFIDVATASPDSPAELTVVADLPAGSAEDPELPHGAAARIMTGSPVPADADTVVPFEDTVGGLSDSLGTITVIRAPRKLGAHVRRAGEDVRRGDEVVSPGEVLGPLQLAAVAASGITEVLVSRRPRVAVVSTGSELVEPGERLRRGQIPESNSRLLAGLVHEAGGIVTTRATVPDETDAFERMLAKLTDPAVAAPADVIIFSGGVSEGAYEIVKQALSDSMSFTKVAMQPGKPQGFGRVTGGALAFGLPGNPVSAAVSFEVFVRPALLALQGRGELHRPRLALRVASGWRTPPGRHQYLPVVIDRTDPRSWRVSPATAGGSHLAGALARAEAYAVVPADTASVAAGDTVEVMLIS
jgi:molybdopterin molybdotransferase